MIKDIVVLIVSREKRPLKNCLTPKINNKNVPKNPAILQITVGINV